MPLHSSRMPGWILLLAGLLAGCGTAPDAKKEGNAQPDTAQPGKTPPRMTTGKEPKRIWAQSLLFCDAPKLEVGDWLTDEPDLEGKFVLIMFWRTWCGACKRAVPKLNAFQEKFGNELAVIAVTGEPAETVAAYRGPEMKFFMALDAPGTKADEEDAIKDQGATEEKYGVWGWPHCVLLEPEHRGVIWEGYPDLKGYELTAEKVEKALAIGRQRRQGKAPPPTR